MLVLWMVLAWGPAAALCTCKVVVRGVLGAHFHCVSGAENCQVSYCDKNGAFLLNICYVFLTEKTKQVAGKSQVSRPLLRNTWNKSAILLQGNLDLP